MAKFELLGPIDLTESEISARDIGNTPGVYILGSVNQAGDFAPWKIGRSDDLASTLKESVGEYLCFKYAHCEDTTDAFVQECRLYHEIRPADNPSHPDKPAEQEACPVCGA